MKKSHLNSFLCVAAFTLITSLVHAATLPLESRLGGLAYYDPNLNITWAADANINGLDNWDNQVAWAAGLTIGGVGGWRLPSANVNGDGTVIDCFGGGTPGCADNEMGFLFWEENIRPPTPGPFSNIQADVYWTGTDFFPSAQPDDAYDFFYGAGGFGASSKSNGRFAWAVHSGDVGVVPVPAAVWLFGSGLISLIGVAIKKVNK